MEFIPIKPTLGHLGSPLPFQSDTIGTQCYRSGIHTLMGILNTIRGFLGARKPEVKQPEAGSVEAWLLDGTWLTVASSDVESIRYLWDERTLEIEFKTGAFYQYSQVPPDTAKAMYFTNSPGRFVWSHLRDAFPFVQISSVQGTGNRQSNVIRPRRDLKGETLPTGTIPPRK